MKECPKCKAQLEDDDIFCGVCGTKLEIENDESQADVQTTPEGRRCSHCGKAIEADSAFCPFCGKPQEVEEVKNKEPQQEEPEAEQLQTNNQISTPPPLSKQSKQTETKEQPASVPPPLPKQPKENEISEPPTYEYEEEEKSRKWLWVLLALLVAGGVGVWYYMSDGHSSRGDSKTAVVDSDYITVSGEQSFENAKDYLESMYKDFYNPYNYERFDKKLLSKYFTEEAMQKFYVESDYDEGDFFYCTDFLVNGSISGGASPDYGDKVVSRTIEPEENDWFLVTNIWDVIKEPVKVYLQVKSDNGVYKIVDIRENNENNSEVQEVNADSYSEFFVGKTYKGSGTGAGLYTEMTITFLDNNICRCISDFYQAYSEPHTITCMYNIWGSQVVVHVNLGDTEYDLEFDITNGGRSIGFDHSDPNEEGMMALDIMSLELQ